MTPWNGTGAVDPGEHIQAYLGLEGSDRLSDHDVAMGVADILCALDPGLASTDAELDLLVHQIEREVSYYR